MTVSGRMTTQSGRGIRLRPSHTGRSDVADKMTS
jgi:hypothetical protein